MLPKSRSINRRVSPLAAQSLPCQCGAQGLANPIQSVHCADCRLNMSRVGALFATPLQQAQSLHTLQYDIEKNQFQLALNQTEARFAQRCMVE